MRNSWVVPLLIGLIPAGAALAAAIIVPTAFSPPISVEITSAKYQGGSTAITLQLTSHRATYLPVTAAQMSGHLVAPMDRPVFYVQDPSFPVYFGSHVDVVAQLQRIDSELSIFGDPTPVTQVSLYALPSVLANNSNAILVDLESGLLPSSLLSPNSSAFQHWLQGGGTLIWAGGPLGFYQSVVGPKGNSVTIGGWAAETTLLGFPLVDPTGNSTSRVPAGLPGPITGGTPSPMADGWQTTYWGVPYGANTSQLSDHLGVDMGWDADGAHPRTSMAVFPEGHGTVFYFGGALGPSGGPPIADAGYALAVDVGRLIGSDFVPTAPAPPGIAHLDLAPFGTQSVTFQVPSPGLPSAVVVQITVGGDPSFFGIWPDSAANFGVGTVGSGGGGPAPVPDGIARPS